MLLSPLLPFITLHKTDGSVLYYSPLQNLFDFRLIRGTFKLPYDSTGGFFEMTIMGNTAGETNTIVSNLAEGFEVLVYVGKTAAELRPAARYVIEKLETEEQSTGLMYIHLSGFDWGTDLMNGRIININVIQDKLATDQSTPDPADTKTTMFNLAHLFLGMKSDGSQLRDASAYPGDAQNDILSKITAKDQGIIIVPDYIYPGSLAQSISVPEIDIRMQRLNDAMSTLDAFDGCVHFVFWNKTFVRQQPYAFSPLVVFSGILLTDDPNDPLLATWNPSTYGLIKPGFKFIRSVESHKVRFYSIGQTDQRVDKSQQSMAAGTPSNHTLFLAKPFTPTKKRCTSIAIVVYRAGASWNFLTPPFDTSPVLDIELREDEQDTPNGAFIFRDQKLPGAIGDGTGGAWHYFAVNQDLNTAKKHWIVIRPTSDTARYFVWRMAGRLNTGTVYSASSTDGANWTNSFTDDLTFIAYFAEPILDIRTPSNPFVDATAKHFHEEVFQRPALSNKTSMDKYVTTQLQTAGKRKETIICEVISPDTFLRPGMGVRIRKQLSGRIMDVDGTNPAFPLFIISGIQYNFDSGTDQTTGQLTVEITASRFIDYEYDLV